MSRINLLLIILISILLVGGGIAIWAAVDNDDEKIPISDVPAKVLEAANSAVPGGEVTGAEKEVENGVLIYDVVKVVDGVEYEIEVTAEGVVNEIEKEGDDEADDDSDSDEEVEVALADVPENVIKAAQEAVPEGNIKKVEKEVEDGVVVYDVEMFVRYEVEVTADGVVKEIEKGDDDEDGEADDDDD
jgi:uncharacterized membrane protein YkoI